uniref:Glycosyltransferase n=1 Tax=Linum usitatissimum TaxID=4006 RepID=I2BHB1_LINUS|nr:UDP-glycosyltransferase 1 [Linum usitatissimum]
MDGSSNTSPAPPHVVFLPFPAQGHIKPMFTLAKLLSHVAKFRITLVNTHHNHALLQRSLDTAAADFGDSFPDFHFASLPDVVAHQDGQSNLANIAQLLPAIRNSKPDFHRLMLDLPSAATCIIVDGVMSYGIEVAEEIGIPAITFRTFSAVGLWVYFNLDKLTEDGSIPIPGNADMDELITSIPGLEGVLRLRDLPSMCRPGPSSQVLKFFIDETKSMKRASGLILNTFDELEGSIISKLSSTIFPKTYPVGPLHGLLNNVVKEHHSDGGLWREDKGCMTWLESHPSKSVVYVSFGSLVAFTEAQFMEFWHGLVNTGKPFLWVIRPDSVSGEDGSIQSGRIISGLKEAHGNKCCVVDWAPQLEVLAHEAVGGFLTHSGWNSTLEAILEGVPMICWPRFSDQQVNSRAVSDIWNVGLDMKDTCDRWTVEKMVRELMDDSCKRDEIVKSTAEIARLARDSIKEGGSSYCNLEKLIADVGAMC